MPTNVRGGADDPASAGHKLGQMVGQIERLTNHMTSLTVE